MIHSIIMRLSILTMLLFLPQAAAAQTVPMTVEALWRLPPGRIGDVLLPPGHAPIARVMIGSPGPPVAETRFIFLYTAATPLGTDFCSQEMIQTNITPVPTDPKAVLDKVPALVGAPTRFTQYRIRPAGESCDGTQGFFSIDGMSVEEGLAAMRVVRDAAVRARRRPLPFPATCRDYILPRCTAKDLLADLDLGSALSVMQPPAESMRSYGAMAKLAMARGWQYRLIELGEVGGMQRTTVEFVAQRGRIMRMSIGSSTIVY